MSTKAWENARTKWIFGKQRKGSPQGQKKVKMLEMLFVQLRSKTFFEEKMHKRPILT